MGATLAAIIMSPWGKQSGGHFNPAITFAFYRLGKAEFWDAWFYVASQFLGAITGVINLGTRCGALRLTRPYATQ